MLPLTCVRCDTTLLDPHQTHCAKCRLQVRYELWELRNRLVAQVMLSDAAKNTHISASDGPIL